MASSYEPKTPLGRFVNELEETVIALLLGVMTLITFTNVILRYGFNTGLIWGSGNGDISVRVAGPIRRELCG